MASSSNKLRGRDFVAIPDETREALLIAYETAMSVSGACRALDVNRSVWHHCCNYYPEFRARYDELKAERPNMLRERLMEMAFDAEKPSFGAVKFALEREGPKEYRNAAAYTPDDWRQELRNMGLDDEAIEQLYQRMMSVVDSTTDGGSE